MPEWSDLRVNVAGMIIRGISGGIVWLIFGAALWFHVLSLWMILVLVILTRLSDGLFGLADNAVLRTIVHDNDTIVHDNESFVKTTSINQVREAVVRIGGGPLCRETSPWPAPVPMLPGTIAARGGPSSCAHRAGQPDSTGRSIATRGRIPHAGSAHRRRRRSACRRASRSPESS